MLYTKSIHINSNGLEDFMKSNGKIMETYGIWNISIS